MRSAVAAHPLDEVSNGHLPLQFRMKSRLGEIGTLQSASKRKL